MSSIKDRYESTEGTWGFSSINRYNELCSSFPRSSNSFPRFIQLVLSDCNSCTLFKQLARSLGLQFVPSIYKARAQGLQFVPSIYKTRAQGLQFSPSKSFSRIELCKSNVQIPIEGNDLC